METKENEECFVPGLALSQSLPHSTHQSLKCGEDTNTEFTNITQNKDHTNDGHCGDAVDTNTAESDTKCYNEEEVDDKCLDLLNPLGVDSDDDVDGDSVEDGHCSQPPITAVCTPPADSHTSAVVRWPRDNGAEDALLPNSGSDQAIPEPIVDSFYTDSSQENKGKPGGSSSSGVQEEIHSDDPPLACTSDEAEEAMREMEGLRAVDLQESQLFAVATEDQTAPEPGPSPVAAKRR